MPRNGTTASQVGWIPRGHRLSVDGFSDRLARLVAGQHRLQPVRAGAAPGADGACWAAIRRLLRSARVGGVAGHGGVAWLGARRVLFRCRRRLYGPHPHLGVERGDGGDFYGVAGFSQGPVMFGICRFFTGVGTGAELVVGSIPLVAEAFAEAQRAKVLGIMMTGGGSRQPDRRAVVRVGGAVWLALRVVCRCAAGADPAADPPRHGC